MAARIRGSSLGILPSWNDYRREASVSKEYVQLGEEYKRWSSSCAYFTSCGETKDGSYLKVSGVRRASGPISPLALHAVWSTQKARGAKAPGTTVLGC